LKFSRLISKKKSLLKFMTYNMKLILLQKKMQLFMQTTFLKSLLLKKMINNGLILQFKIYPKNKLEKEEKKLSREKKK
jgi:hypothetical protein